jgi:hypothetical protein
MAKFNLERIKDIVNLTRQLAVGLRDLNFNDNFSSYIEEITIPATTEYRVRHDLNTTPSGYIIKEQTGNGLVTKGTTEADSNYYYLYNNGAVSVTITVIILK